MSRTVGATNLKESSRQAAIRLLAEGKNKEDTIRTLIELGAKPSTASQNYYFAKRHLTQKSDKGGWVNNGEGNG